VEVVCAKLNAALLDAVDCTSVSHIAFQVESVAISLMEISIYGRYRRRAIERGTTFLKPCCIKHNMKVGT
jgi:hypothetical protein